MASFDLPGRGARMNAPLCYCMHDVVEDIYEQIKNFEIRRGYILFGHSMGAIVSFELAKRILRETGYPAKHIFFSGSNPPNVPSKHLEIYNAEDRIFIEEIRKMGGTNEDFFENKELMQIFLPIIRADYQILETYQPNECPLDIKCDLTVMYGTEDNTIDLQNIGCYSRLTSKSINVRTFTGNHFYINQHKNTVIEMINKAAEEYI